MIKALIALPAFLLFLAFGAQAANFDSIEQAKTEASAAAAAQREEIMENAKNSGPVLFIDNVYSSYGKRGSQEALMERLHAAGLETVTK